MNHGTCSSSTYGSTKKEIFKEQGRLLPPNHSMLLPLLNNTICCMHLCCVVDVVLAFVVPISREIYESVVTAQRRVSIHVSSLTGFAFTRERLSYQETFENMS
jgi:hypothetical protein